MEEAWELAALVMKNKGTEISLSKDGFTFKTDGEASERLANAALDFLGPITEGAGFLGTKLRGYRMEAALKSTIRAKKICQENGLPINPVPPKFLLQWVEGASLEDVESDENVSEIWANLLVSKSSGDIQNAPIFIDIIKKIDWSHKNALEKFVENEFPSTRVISAIGHKLIAEFHFGRSINKSLQKDISGEGLEEIVFQACMHKSAALVTSYVLQKRSDWETENFEFDDGFNERLSILTEKDLEFRVPNGVDDDIFLGLESLGLIEYFSITDVSVNKEFRMNVFLWKLTPFGYKFLESCLFVKNKNDK